MEDINWCDACDICQKNAEQVNKECGPIVYSGPKEVPVEIIKEIKVGDSNMYQTLSITLGIGIIGLLIIGYVLWSRLNDIITAKLDKDVEKRIDEAVKNFTYECQNDITKNLVTIRVIRNN